MEKFILAIDPGVSGGYAIVGSNGSIIYSKKTNKDEKYGGIDVEQAIRCFEDYVKISQEKMLSPQLDAVIEDVHAIFGSGAKSNFEFGRNLGEVISVCKVIGCEINKIDPKTWQKKSWIVDDIVYKKSKVKKEKHFFFNEEQEEKKEKRRKVDTKNTSRNAALRIFGEEQCEKFLKPTKRSRVYHDGITDAALIGYAYLKSL